LTPVGVVETATVPVDEEQLVDIVWLEAP